MDWQALEDNSDDERIGCFPYQELRDVLRAGRRDTCNHVVDKIFDLFLASGWKPSEIIESVSDVATQKFNHNRVVYYLDEAASQLFEFERDNQSEATKQTEPEATESNS